MRPDNLVPIIMVSSVRFRCNMYKLSSYSVSTIRVGCLGLARLSPDERSNMALTNSLGATSGVIYCKAMHR